MNTAEEKSSLVQQGGVRELQGGGGGGGGWGRGVFRGLLACY